MKKGSKRVERPGLSSEEVEEIKQAFDLFDTNSTGKIDPKELKAAMQSLGFDSKNPTIYQLIVDLDTPDAERNGEFPLMILLMPLMINQEIKNQKKELEEFLIYLQMIQMQILLL